MSKIIKLKKLIAKVLQMSFIGQTIRVLFNDSIKYKGVYISTKSSKIANSTVSSLFFNMYESCETRFIKKYLNRDLSTIEFGSSIGVTGSMIGSLSSHIIILVEANQGLIPILQQNAEHNIDNYEIVNAAIDYSSKRKNAVFSVNEFSDRGKLISNGKSTNSIEIPITTLSQIKSSYNIGKYNLICDIEGAEVGLFLEENTVLNECDTLIIELHKTIYKNCKYSIRDIKDIILEKGFMLMDSYIEVFCFKHKI